ncbi:MAG: helix-turn-helix domain-containing protein [Fervidicoccaceae archaeon]|jgi:transcription initiation factor TFIIE subunit alpha|uniref:Transcription factor E n=1 Tax=Fervidicoccus fontis TaxID=683846 RepID=A0A7C2Z024_9CREN|nr:MAG: transcription factor [Fervidicoccus sp.]HEU98113.1 HTH domain-containing protein [Fervidicoccus fontis]
MSSEPSSFEDEKPEDGLEEYIYKLAPKGSLTLFRLLKNEREELTEDEISEKLGISKNTVRKILYKLHDLNILVYRRMKEESTNWNTYYWKINWEGISLSLLNRKKEVLHKLRLRLAYEQANRVVYHCPKCGREYKFEEALANDFTCPICGVSLEYIDRSKEIAILEDYVRRLEEELADELKKIQSS